MKKSIVTVGTFLFLLFLLPALAGGACPLGYTPMTTVTTYPDGPYGSIYVETSPPGAIVFVNGVNHGHSPATITGLYKGTYSILVQMSGFEDFKTTTTISGPTRSSVYCPLVPDNTGTGIYVMSTPPRANVYFDNILKGEAPVMISNPVPGPHRIVVNLSGYDDWESTVTAPSSGTKTVAAVLEENKDRVTRGINITTNPAGARVLLDSTDRGVTPLTLGDVAEGIHILELEYPGYNAWKSTVNVPDTGMKTVSVNLTPEPAHAPGWITVSSDPGNASVTLDGEYAGRTPAAGSILNLGEISPGEHTVVVVLSGYRSQVIKTTVSPNLVSPLNATLVPDPGPASSGTFSVISDPPGATVWIDGSPAGVSPLTADGIPAGDHEIGLSMDGYENYSVSILLGAGTTREVSATLVPVATRSLYSPLPPATALYAVCIIGLLFLRYRR
jgi:hypothetical protein